MSDLSDLIRNIKATHGLTPAYEMHGLLYQCLGAFETLQRECDAWQDKYSAQLAKRLRAYARIETLQRENEALKHDIARHVAIASEEATRAEHYRAALETIVAFHSGYCEHHVGVSKHSYDLADIAVDALSQFTGEPK